MNIKYMIIWLGSLLFVANAQADPSHYNYFIENGEAIITGYTGPGGDIVIPDELGGAPVRVIGNYDEIMTSFYPVFSSGLGADITGIVIPDSVTNISPHAFRMLRDLAAVTIGSNVRSIGEGAFANCPSLLHLEIPDSVISIQSMAFVGSTQLNLTIGRGLRYLGTSIYGNEFQDPVFGDSSLRSYNVNVVIDGHSISSKDDFGRPNSEFFQVLRVHVLNQAITAAIIEKTGNYDIAIKADLTNVYAAAVQEVQSSPNEFGLYDAADYNANFETGFGQGRVTGQADVTSNPASYDLYDQTSIMDLNYGGLMLRAEEDGFELEFTIEQATDLVAEDWMILDRIAYSVAATNSKAFLRIRSDYPYVEPTVKINNHSSYGALLTDQAGRVLYFFSADSPGGNPQFSGSTWPYVPSPGEPVPDLGVTAALDTSNYGMGPEEYLIINGRPTYYYSGDTKPGDANGQGLGSVWWSIKPDGTINN
jgi:predicted lipoprotein with Yx(FWY)xxD motif